MVATAVLVAMLALVAVAVAVMGQIGDLGPFIAGTYRVDKGPWRWTPISATTVYSGRRWWRCICGISVGTFGRFAYVAWCPEARGQCSRKP